MQILIGTSNPAKLNRYRTILQQFPQLQVVAPADLGIVLPIAEDGLTAEDNARKKATAYATSIGIPTLGIDEALTIPALPREEQPGTLVRRYLGAEATDEALLAVFLEKTRRLAPSERIAIWIYALCLALPDGQTFCGAVELRKWLTDRPSVPIVPGYPLSSLQVDPLSGKVLRDLTPAEEQQHLLPVYEAVAGLIRAAQLDRVTLTL